MEQNYDFKETRKYLKPLTPQELDVKHETAANKMIEISRLKRDLKLITKRFKDQIDPLLKEQEDLLTQIHSKQQEVSGNLYLFANQEEGKMYTYDENGEEVESRRLRPEERQAKIFDGLKKAVGE